MRNARRLGLSAAAAAGLTLSIVGPALADYGPAPLDVVGAGSDTVQNIMDFAADGRGSTPGFNTTGNKYKLVSLDATGDANDRSLYLNGGTTPTKLTVIYRAGASPQQRANGSGAGITALLADTGTPETINWVRMSRLPKSTEEATANTNGWGGLHVVKIATDDLVMAADKASTNAVALTGAQLVSVYQCGGAGPGGALDWHTFNSSAPANSWIVAQVPQAGSGTGDSFRADLAAANGGTAVTTGACVQTTEENDPAAITTNANSVNAIQPMSDGRVALFDSGYFHDPSGAFPTGTSVTSGVSLIYGTGGLAQTPNACVAPTNPAGAGNSLAYCDTRGLYVVWRESDSNSSTIWQPGGTKNWVQQLFWRPSGGGTPYIKTAGGQAAVAAGGVSAVYVDCGVNPSTC